VELYTLVALTERFDTKEATIRFRLKQFSEYIETVGRGKNRRYSANALPVIEFIMDCYGQNMKSLQIGDLLAEQYPKIIDVAIEETGIVNETDSINEVEMLDNEQVRAMLAELLKRDIEKDKRIDLLESKLLWQGESQSAKINDMAIAISEISRVQRNKRWWKLW
jgi:hypothetical protein